MNNKCCDGKFDKCLYPKYTRLCDYHCKENHNCQLDKDWKNK